ncbi:MAG: hypothetical protein NDI60_02715 [Elusimicrobiales bacterium]|nr:hypothetical protein [Elusimicrobiales bacterium]
MRNIAKRSGTPLIFASMVLFGLANRAEGMWLNWLAAAVMGLGMVLFVLSALFPPAGQPAASSAPPPPRANAHDRFAGDSFYKRMAHSSAPEPIGEVPAWVYLLCGAISVVGAAAFMLGPNGVSPRTVISFSMIPGGPILFLAAKVAYGGAIALRNVLRSIVAVLGFLVLFGGIMTGVLLFAGAFAPENTVLYAFLAAAALLAGMALAYYGMKYQQGPEGVEIGRELGFQDAGGDDGVYDSKGEMNGVEIMFNVEQEAAHHSRHGSSPAHFRLEVLCACANPRGLRLEVQPDGFLNFSLSGLPKAPHVDYWDYYDIRANLPDVAAGPLAAAKAGDSVFNEQTGFSRLTLDGNELKLVFEQEGYAGTQYVHRILEEASRLALAFS